MPEELIAVLNGFMEMEVTNGLILIGINYYRRINTRCSHRIRPDKIRRSTPPTLLNRDPATAFNPSVSIILTFENGAPEITLVGANVKSLFPNTILESPIKLRFPETWYWQKGPWFPTVPVTV